MTLGALNHEPVSYLRIAKIGAHGQNLESRMPVRRVHASHRAVAMRPSQKSCGSIGSGTKKDCS